MDLLGNNSVILLIRLENAYMTVAVADLPVVEEWAVYIGGGLRSPSAPLLYIKAFDLRTYVMPTVVTALLKGQL